MALTKDDLTAIASLINEAIETMINPRFDHIETRLDRVETTLHEHTVVLNEHTTLLNQHTRLLNEHTQTLIEHGRLLREHELRLYAIETTVNRIDGRLIAVEDDIKELYMLAP